MLSFMQETATVWENLQQATKPIVLYGMGNGADRILDKCIGEHIPVAGVFASDEFVRGQVFRSYPVLTYPQALEKWGDFVVVIAFASEDPQILARFFGLAAKHETYAPHVAVFHGDELVSKEWLTNNEERLQAVYAGWEDEASRQVMADALNYKLSGKMQYLKHVTARKHDLQELFDFSPQESYADLGAYNGDTITEFLELTGGVYQHVYALEPDKKNFQKLKNYVEQEQLGQCTLVNKAIWSTSGTKQFYQRGGRMSSLGEAGKIPIDVVSLDEVVGQQPLSYIKMDVEGVEYQALMGAAQVLLRCQPKLFVAAYHHDNDFLVLPETIKMLNPEYKLYLRRHPYVPCWELNILAK